VKYWIVNGKKILTTTKMYTVAALKGNFDIKAVFGEIDPSGGRDSNYNGTNKGRLGVNLLIAPSGLSGGLNAVFDPAYLESLEPYSVLRTGSMTGGNGHTAPGTGQWSNRVLPDGNQNTAQGAAWEYVIALGNATKKDLWINIPLMADDDYLYNLAQLMKDNLDPNITLYLEWSNEVWGFGAEVAYNEQLAMEKGINDRSNLWSWRNSSGAYGWGEMFRLQHYAQKAADIAHIFREVFEEDDRPVSEDSKIKMILAWQTMPDFITPMFDWLNN
jgi:hypothetical protein